MLAEDSIDVTSRFASDGFVSPLDILSVEEAADHRRRMEEAEAEFGKLHYEYKVHTILSSPYELAIHPRVLDAVEKMIGADILLYSAGYIVKEPHSEGHVSWHQDLTYWGFSEDAEVSLWLALSPATAESGCMRMLPGSHRGGRLKHQVTDDSTNILYQGQTVSDVDEDDAVLCPLQPGQASFHHGWTLHASTPNRSVGRRIGLNVQYIAPSMRQTKHDKDTAMLVRGEDRFGYFGKDVPAVRDLDPTAMARRAALAALMHETQSRE